MRKMNSKITGRPTILETMVTKTRRKIKCKWLSIIAEIIFSRSTFCSINADAEEEGYLEEANWFDDINEGLNDSGNKNTVG